MSSEEDDVDLFGENDPDDSEAEEHPAQESANGDADENDAVEDRASNTNNASMEDDERDDQIEVDGDNDREDGHDESTQHTLRPQSHTSTPQPEPPDSFNHLRSSRSSLFQSILDPSQPNYSLALDPVAIINLATPCHVLATTPCLTYLLAGCQDGHIRAYDFWASVQGKAVMTTAQKQTANLGDAVIKGGVSKGWWKNEVEVEVLESEVDTIDDAAGDGKKTGSKGGPGGPGNKSAYEDFKKRKEASKSQSQPTSAFGFLAGPSIIPQQPKTSNPFGLPMDTLNGSAEAVKKVRIKRLEPVYGMAVQSEGLWAVHGSTSGLINLTTLRHSPGKTIHTLGGGPTDHTGPISTISLLPGEKGMITGGWDKTVKEWDLNTGKVVRTYTGHEAEISAVQLRPSGAKSGGGKGGLTISVGAGMGSQDDKSANGKEGEDGKGKLDDDVEMAAPEDTETTPTTAPYATNDKPTETESKGSPAESDEGSLFAFDDDEDRDAAGEPDDDATEMAVDPMVTPNQKPTPANAPPPSHSIPAETTVRKRRFGDFAFASRPCSSMPSLTPETYNDYSSDIMMVASIDGEVALHDRRVAQSKVGRLETGERTPPWCMSACFSSDGNQVIAGRQNATLDVWDVRRMGGGGTGSAPSLLKNLRNPVAAKEISAVAAFPDGRHIACAGNDCVRLWNTHDLWDPDSSMKKSKSTVPFRIVAGHHGGMISQILIDPTGRFMLTASGNRGWQGDTTRVILAHELKT